MNNSQSFFTISKQFKSFGEFFSDPKISGMCQAFPISSGIAAYIAGSYNQEQFKTLEAFLNLLNEKVKILEEKYIDKDFINSPEGQRIVGKILRSILSDNRKEKLEAMANLTTNVYIIYSRSKLTFDEKEIYVNILDGLNYLQLSTLQKAVIEIRERRENKHRGFSWEKFAVHYEKKGISKDVLLHSIRVLENNGLVNKNNATVTTVDQTHFLTTFGEKFYNYISELI